MALDVQSNTMLILLINLKEMNLYFLLDSWEDLPEDQQLQGQEEDIDLLRKQLRKVQKHFLYKEHWYKDQFQSLKVFLLDHNRHTHQEKSNITML